MAEVTEKSIIVNGVDKYLVADLKRVYGGVSYQGEEYVFLTLVAYAAINTFQISDEIFVDAIDDDALFSYFCHVYHLTTNL